ncbi:hypothetical protein DFJ74DRAFT_531476, partial [Hyaloraphidium curvatum]
CSAVTTVPENFSRAKDDGNGRRTRRAHSPRARGRGPSPHGSPHVDLLAPSPVDAGAAGTAPDLPAPGGPRARGQILHGRGQGYRRQNGAGRHRGRQGGGEEGGRGRGEGQARERRGQPQGLRREASRHGGRAGTGPRQHGAHCRGRGGRGNEGRVGRPKERSGACARSSDTAIPTSLYNLF